MKATAAVALAILAIIGVLYVATVPDAPPPEMTEAGKANLIASATQAAREMIAAFDAEDSDVYFSFYSDWADYPAAGSFSALGDT